MIHKTIKSGYQYVKFGNQHRISMNGKQKARLIEHAPKSYIQFGAFLWKEMEYFSKQPFY